MVRHMATKMHIKKGDIVVAISGEDAVKGKTGKVLQVIPRRGVALVEGFNYVSKHMKPTQDNPRGSILKKEAPMPVSKLRVYSANDSKKVSAD